MKVKDLMTSEVVVCHPETDVATAVKLMWDHDCGVLPVIDGNNSVVGIITDRDICIALGTRDRRASTMAVGDVAPGIVYSASPDDDVQSALKTMRHNRVHRLPVLDDKGGIAGILSLNDVVLRAEEEKGRHHPDLNYEDAMSTIKAICEHRPAQYSVAAAQQ